MASRPILARRWAGWHYCRPSRFLAHKAEHSDKSVAGYREYYTAGYRADMNRVVIKGDQVTFEGKDKSFTGGYAYDGYEILTYKKGKRSVRFIFHKRGGDAEAPGFIQFSDHRSAPEKTDQYHLDWGDDRAALLKEVTNWPTYFPSSMSGKEVADVLMAH